MRLLLCLTMICLKSPLAFAATKIMLDAGHGGKDSGAVCDHLKESNLALKITKKLGAFLEKDKDFEVYYTRSEDHFVDLDKRVLMSEKLGADLFLSIHINSSPDSRARGKEIYFQNLLPPEEESLYLAKLENDGKPENSDEDETSSDLQLILQDLKKNHKALMSSQLSEALLRNWGVKGIRRQRPIRQAPFLVVTKTKIPSVLVEVGYLTNSKEAQNLDNSNYQDRLASGLYMGIKEFKELIDKRGLRNLD